MTATELARKLAEAANAIRRLQDALALPFSPVTLVPVIEARRAVDDLIGENARLRNENTRLRAHISSLEALRDA